MYNKLMRGDDVAIKLGVSKSFVYQMIRDGDIPCIRLGRAVRVRETDVDAYIEQNINCGKDINCFAERTRLIKDNNLPRENLK